MISVEMLGALYHGTLLISEAYIIWYILKYNPGQRVTDWLFGRDER